MPFTQPQRDYDIAWAFSNKIETAYGTALAFADIDQSNAFDTPEAFVIERERKTNAAKFGKGHEWGTTSRDVAQSLRFTRSGDLSTLVAGLFLPLSMGKVVTVGTGPYDHTITPKLLVDGLSSPSTTVWVKKTAAVRGRAAGIVCNDWSISGRNREAVQYTANFIGKGSITDEAHSSQPTFSPELILIGGDVVVNMGAPGAAVSIGERVLDWTVTYSQNVSTATAAFPGSGLFYGRMFIGARRITVTLRVFSDETADMWNLFINGTVQEVQFNCAGDASNHLNIKIPSVKWRLSDAYEDGKHVNVLTATEDDVFIGQAGATPADVPIQCVLRNQVAAYLQTP